jgi:nucleotide-binding universal stress UspA family protein
MECAIGKEAFMNTKILIALDDSEAAWRGVEYVARAFGKRAGVEVTLFHVLAGLPASLWEEGHILTDEEKRTRKNLIVTWERAKEKKWEDLVERAKGRLEKAGISSAGVRKEFEPDYSNVAQEIIHEARTGGYSTVVLGRRGLGPIKSFLVGSVTNKVLHHAQGFAVTVVE